MTRDMDLVREILLWATNPQNPGYGNPEFPQYTPEQIGYHVHIMSQAGLVEAIDMSSSDNHSRRSALLLSVTWAGHDFVDAARNNSLWKLATTKVLKSGAAFTFEVLKEYLVLNAKERLGLR